MEDHDTTPAGKPRLTAFGRKSRRERIFERLRQGWSYETIASVERLSEKHVRRIVSKYNICASGRPTRRPTTRSSR